ncbi:hypothetical protein [Prauserella endophytica]|uniref:Uncharacterized protein n=1 Tax=Prauserella endophytica TaxID=1592324 RepID=A0ABY2RZY4_9PSEU|nr:hypothetical protein [Prauserella endophytica]PXY20348.1 hypothetical protein BAY59_31415 [Prauserella coralliicola]TKG66950.1 hypothetical protein FCN18_23860 [Prauserella endophytica]
MAELLALSPIERPNGKTYRPRKIVGFPWENDGWTNDDCGVIVFGTHDIEAAREFAHAVIDYNFGNDLVPTKPHIGWWRDGFENGERVWRADPVRGRAGVMFTAGYPEEARRG